MPGTFFVQPSTWATLAGPGDARFDRNLSLNESTAQAANLGYTDSLHATRTLRWALAYGKTGDTTRRNLTIAEILKAPGTEEEAGQTSATEPQGLDMFRGIFGYITAADICDMDGNLTVTSGQFSGTFDDWVRTLPTRTIGGQTNWNELLKTARVSGNNWGAMARSSLLVVGAWLRKRNKTATNGMTGQQLIDEAIKLHKMVVGDIMPHGFTPSSVFQTGWDGPDTSYPGKTQGVINPASSNADLDGAISEDAGRGSAAPPMVGAGRGYTREAYEAMAAFCVVAYNLGYTDVWSWGNNAMRRTAINAKRFDAFHYHEIGRPLPYLVNYLFNIGYSTLTPTQGMRQMPATLDWLTASGSTWLKTSGETGGGGGGTVGNTAPKAAATATVTGPLTVNVDATASTAGTVNGATSTISKVDFGWGDGFGSTDSSGPTWSAARTYTTAGTKTITVKVTDTNGLTDQIALSVNLTSDQPPVASFTVTPQIGPAPLAVVVDSTASNDPEGGSITRAINWGDGSSNSSVTATAGHTYSTAGTYNIQLTVTDAGGLTGQLSRVVTVIDPVNRARATVYVGTQNGWSPAHPGYGARWNEDHPVYGQGADEFHIWWDGTGTMRHKLGAPTSATDGTAIGTAGGAVTSHTALTDRTAADSHPISAITGLQAALDALKAISARTASFTLPNGLERTPVEYTSTSLGTVTLPSGLTYIAGTVLGPFVQMSTGRFAAAAGTGVTILAPDNQFTTRGPGSFFFLRYRGSNAWHLYGDTAA